jgi:hypothetical protein
MTELPRNVLELAISIRKTADWDALPVLADMLEEAGFRNEDILNHLRLRNYVHETGYCWVVWGLTDGRINGDPSILKRIDGHRNV